VVVAALQAAGMAVVAMRDWYNFAGAGGYNFRACSIASDLTFGVVLATAGAAGLSVLVLMLFPTEGRRLRRSPAHVAAALAVALGLPVLLCATGLQHSQRRRPVRPVVVPALVNRPGRHRHPPAPPRPHSRRPKRRRINPASRHLRPTTPAERPHLRLPD
jgi:hypothetical protein